MAERRATAPKEWALALAGGLLLAFALVQWLRPAPESAPAIALNAPPMPENAPEPPRILPETAREIVPSGLILRGLLLPDAAIIETSGGQQWLIRRGRPTASGLQLSALSAQSATLETASGAEITLQLEGSERTAVPVAAASPQGVRRATRAELAASVTDYRLALRAMGGAGNTKESKDIPGWRVSDPNAVPMLRLAGLQAGDVLLAVNGQPLFSEEKLMDLPAEVAGARALTLEYARGGTKNTVTIQIAP